MWDQGLNLTQSIWKMSSVNDGSARILVTDRSGMGFRTGAISWPRSSARDANDMVEWSSFAATLFFI